MMNILLKQQGSALIVSLIMLTSVTFLAILSLQGSTTQIRIVSNLQIKEEVFHTARREISTTYDIYENDITKIIDLSLAMEKSALDDVSVLEASPLNNNSKIDSVSSHLKSMQKIAVGFNYSLGDGYSGGTFSPLPFEIQSSVIDSTKRFRSSQVLGFQYSAPVAH